jgi:glycolate oxidase FAD binding subunit
LPKLLEPGRPEDLRDTLGLAAASRQSIEVFGGDSKRLMAGRVESPDVRISTARMRRILQYEPRDLTVSVEAGLPFAELNAQLAKNGQTIPLDGPWSENATVGGMVAANISGARRRRYGSARDMVIGMTFATLEGKLVETGGMVVKNVAGLDIAKLMIGSFGTLAAIASVNFRVTARPEVTRTMLFACDNLESALGICNHVLTGVLNPAAVEILNPVLAAQLGLKNFHVAIQFGGSPAIIARSVKEVERFGTGKSLSGEEEQRFWQSLTQLTPGFLEKFRDGAVVRVSAKLADCGEALRSVEGPGLAHAGTGVVRGWFTRPDAASRWLATALKRGWKGVIEFSGEGARPGLALWPEALAAKSGGDFAIMKEIKRMFDPEGLLNRGRLFNQI